MPGLRIWLVPTKRIEEIHGFKFRVYVGHTDEGNEIEMLGLFRLNDPVARAKFQARVCAVDKTDPDPVRLVGDGNLVAP